MKRRWSNPVTYDLTRTLRRVSVPEALGNTVPEVPGTYAICRIGQAETFEIILDIGECGPRPNSRPHGLRGRLAAVVAHSASEQIARDLQNGSLQGNLCVVWFETESKGPAKEIQDALISLFRRDCGKQPRYNTKHEWHAHPDNFRPIYLELKVLTGCSR